jgi:predicted small lipoprotein YifL
MSLPQMTRIAFLVLFAASVSACGRAGPLEPPPAAAAAKTGQQDVPAEDKPFILDPLL